jgi:8-oxo-dGTP diphosphatase
MPRYRRGPALTVDAVWVERGRVLLVRRGRPPFQGKRALPGGFVEPDETVEHAVARELREETGLRARPYRLVGVYSGPRRDPRGPTASVVFLMRGRSGPPRAADDAAAAEWVPISAARGLAFDHDEIVRDALRRRRSRGHREP